MSGKVFTAEKSMEIALQLYLSVLISSVGLGYAVYGKKQKRLVALIAGIILLVAPYLVSNIYAMLFIGVTLMALPFLISI